MSVRVPVRPEMLQWAIERSQRPVDELLTAVPQLPKWMAQDSAPTLRQLEKFASATRIPLPALLVEEPVDEDLGIADFRTVGSASSRPSPELLDTVRICRQRQDWFADELHREGAPSLAFVGSMQAGSSVEATAASIRATIGLQVEVRAGFGRWDEAFSSLVDLVVLPIEVGNAGRRVLTQ